MQTHEHDELSNKEYDILITSMNAQQQRDEVNRLGLILQDGMPNNSMNRCGLLQGWHDICRHEG